VTVYLIKIIFSNITPYLILDKNALYMPWKFITSIFIHATPDHLLSNLFALLLFGFILEKIIGSKKFLIVFLSSSILTNITGWMLYDSSLGASGVIMTLIGILIILKPLMTVWAFNLPLPMTVAGIIWFIIDILGALGFGKSNTGYAVHITGILVGLLFGAYLRIKKIEDPTLIKEEKIILPENMIKNWEDTHIKSR
jgi:membrane associated rhomboid family serine protease